MPAAFFKNLWGILRECFQHSSRTLRGSSRMPTAFFKNLRGFFENATSILKERREIPGEYQTTPRNVLEVID
jgi:hypothetical protein